VEEVKSGRLVFKERDLTANAQKYNVNDMLYNYKALYETKTGLML